MAVRVALVLAVVVFVVQAAVVRPRLWPAGAGLVISGGTVTASLGEARAFAALRPPEVRAAAGQPATIAFVWPGGLAQRAGVRPGQVVTAIRGPEGQVINLADGFPDDSAAILRLWRESWSLGPSGRVSLDLLDGEGRATTVDIDRPRGGSRDASTRWAWVRQHVGRLVELGAFLLGAAALVVLGVTGKTATLTTLALIVPPLADSGPLLGAERAFGWFGPVAAQLMEVKRLTTYP